MPSSAECLHQGNCRNELLATQRGGGELDVQRRAFGSCHFEISDEAVTVLIIDYFELFTGSHQSITFRGVLVCEKRLGCKAVFHFRKSRQDALAVGGDHFLVTLLCETQTSAE